MALETLHDVARVHGTDEHAHSVVETTRSRTRSCRDIVCWHCGRRGHMRQRCFRRIRQHKKRQMLHDLHMADASTTHVVLDASVTTSPCTLFQKLLLDTGALFHAIPDRQWFSTYSAVRHDCADSLGGDVAGIGDIHVVFADGASMVLHDVRHMPQIAQCVVFVPQLRDEGYVVTHTEHSWKIHRGSLVVVRGARSGITFPLYCSYIRAGAVHVVALPCREVERRRVSFQEALGVHVIHDTVLPLSDVQTEPEVQCLSSERHVESVDSSLDARQGQSSVVVTGLATEPEMHAFFFDACDSFEVDSDLHTAVQGTSMHRQVERECSSESQQWESDCSGAESLVLQSFSDMPLPDADMVMHGQVVPEDAFGAELADRDRLAQIAHVLSAFGSLMYDILLSRPDLAYAVGAFAVGVVSRW